MIRQLNWKRQNDFMWQTMVRVGFNQFIDWLDCDEYEYENNFDLFCTLLILTVTCLWIDYFVNFLLAN